MNDSEYITDDVEKQVLDLADSLYDLRSEHFKEIKEAKESEREKARNEISNKVLEWKKQWEGE